MMKWYRVVLYAQATCDENGRCTVDADFACTFGDTRNLKRAVNGAIKRGLLEPTSTTECLVVPEGLGCLVPNEQVPDSVWEERPQSDCPHHNDE